MLVAVARVGTADRGHHASEPAEAAEAASPERTTRPARPRPKQPEVLITTATTGAGIPELLAALNRHRAVGREGMGAAARLARAEAQIWSILADRTRAALAEPHRRDQTAAVLQAVADHELDPFAAVDRLLATLRE